MEELSTLLECIRNQEVRERLGIWSIDEEFEGKNRMWRISREQEEEQKEGNQKGWVERIISETNKW